ncbi:Beta-lactamase enzyme family protein [Poseidonocella pacifica]|uniref:Beta-lactamase enzyme family protein n=1 Tax=Poseidonocella pacifica TaxID=871651 RepID=A0A1I0X9F6_9RHOB|nr:serine hydrolase [Poseidonocella pacifica]SFA97655.1 Beta-lactamase enzyme family protein [Poseidonocella pacifica]
MAVLLAGPAGAVTPADQMRAIYRTDAPISAFSGEFLAALPLETVQTFIDELRDVTGPILDVEEADDGLILRTRSHDMTARITLSEAGQITGLWFGQPVPIDVSLEEVEARLGELPGEVSWIVVREGEVLSRDGGDKALAVGSAFKLAVLAVLRDEIAAETRAWDDVVRLRNRHRALPSGILQDFPEGAPLTLHSVAALMIAMSDNTATDLLIDVLGRDAVAEKLGVEDLLSTREFFALKSSAGLRDRYLGADGPEARREAAVAAASAARLDPGKASMPHMAGIEWYVPVERLCTLMGEVAHLDLMAIPSQSVPLPVYRFGRVAFKGGSENGVLNLTAQFRDEQAQDVCVSLTVNAEGGMEVDDVTHGFAALASVFRD